MPIIAANFTLGAPFPIDDRQVVATKAELNTLPNKYEGLIVYVTGEKKVYVYKNSSWEELVPAPTVDEETETLIIK